MIEIKKYTACDKNLWDNFVDKAKNSIFMLKRDFMDYHADRFVDYSLLFYKDGLLIALLPLNIKENVVYSHGGLTFGGFILDERMKQSRMLECFEELKTFLRSEGVEAIVYKPIPYIYHSIPAQEDLYALFVQGAQLVKRDVSTTIDLKNPIKMPKGRKSQISRARREGVKIETSENFDAFIELENKVLSEKYQTKAVHTADELRLLKKHFPNEIQLVTAVQCGELIAASLFFVYKFLVHTQYLASSEKGREVGALDLLISEQISFYQSSKKYFDFGISTENDGKFLNTGLIHQKEGFGGRAVCYDVYKCNV